MSDFDGQKAVNLEKLITHELPLDKWHEGFELRIKAGYESCSYSYRLIHDGDIITDVDAGSILWNPYNKSGV